MDLPALSCILFLAPAPTVCQDDPEPPRLRDLGITIGELPHGPLDAITDVAGVAVGHLTLREGEDLRTGVTVIDPCHGENAYLRKLPAAVHTANGYGKAAGFTQVAELGELEAPIALTNTLSVGAVLDAMVAETLARPGMEAVRSINVVVGETNDGFLNDIRARAVTREHVAAAWANASPGAVEQGCVGAGTGTVCFGFKGGIGTSSRVAGDWTVGVLVQTNFGGDLRVDGRPLPPLDREGEGEPAGPAAGRTGARDRDGGTGGTGGRDDGDAPGKDGDGSCMVVVATDAPLDARNLERLAKRAILGLARTGSYLSNGSGDYAIAFSTHEANRIDARARGPYTRTVLPNHAMTPLFQAAVEATEQAVLESLVAAHTTRGRAGHVVRALDHDRLRELAGER